MEGTNHDRVRHATCRSVLCRWCRWLALSQRRTRGKLRGNADDCIADKRLLNGRCSNKRCRMLRRWRRSSRLLHLWARQKTRFKLPYLPTRLHGVTSQKALVFAVHTVSWSKGVLVSAVKVCVVSTLDTGRRSTALPGRSAYGDKILMELHVPQRTLQMLPLLWVEQRSLFWLSLPVLPQSHGRRTERLTLEVTVWSTSQNDLTAVHSVMWLHWSSVTWCDVRTSLKFGASLRGGLCQKQPWRQHN